MRRVEREVLTMSSALALRFRFLSSFALFIILASIIFRFNTFRRLMVGLIYFAQVWIGRISVVHHLKNKNKYTVAFYILIINLKINSYQELSFPIIESLTLLGSSSWPPTVSVRNAYDSICCLNDFVISLRDWQIHNFYFRRFILGLCCHITNY